MTASSASTPGASHSDSLTRRQQRAQATADQLLLAARSVFEDQGYRRTTVGAITRAANTAHGTFYLYFKNKEDAFQRVMEAVVADLARQSAATWDGDPKESMRRVVAGFFGVIAQHRGLWRCLMEGMLQSPRIEQMWLELRRPFIARTERALERLVAAGHIRDIDPLATAAAFGNMIEWSAFTATELGEPPGLSQDRSIDAIADIWSAALFGDGAGRG